ncbi:hypothetical protein B0A54_09106 [Friedmanniomyces endolithicus]|uniref:F-box domain-containing protein n=1 Tax=Friedmanniomyces endolithicus TaxID=329885 RepID=A0A4U0UZC7_9PEZI|nr:hypothetical protein B0A54_09106 [Friedmanniomyces endolithicus]
MGHNAMDETSAKETTAKSSPNGIDHTTNMPDEILVKILAYAITPTTICHPFGHQSTNRYRRYLQSTADLAACERFHRLAQDAYSTHQLFAVTFESNCHICIKARPLEDNTGYLRNDFRFTAGTSDDQLKYYKLITRLRLEIEVAGDAVLEVVGTHMGSMLQKCEKLAHVEVLLTLPRCCEVQESALEMESRARVFTELFEIINGHLDSIREQSGRQIKVKTICCSCKEKVSVDGWVISCSSEKEASVDWRV